MKRYTGWFKLGDSTDGVSCNLNQRKCEVNVPNFKSVKFRQGL